MATQITSIRLPKELSERYSRLAEATGCTHYYYITEALEGATDEFEHEAELIKIVEDYRAGTLANANRTRDIAVDHPPPTRRTR